MLLYLIAAYLHGPLDDGDAAVITIELGGLLGAALAEVVRALFDKRSEERMEDLERRIEDLEDRKYRKRRK